MFSKSCEYGIRALTVIGKAQLQNKKIGIKEICKIAKTPESFTAKILQNLVKRNIINSQKGPSGGFYISRDMGDITLMEIVTAIDGDEMFNKCGLGLNKCDANNPCPLHNQYEGVRNNLVKMCKSSSLMDLTSATVTKAYDK